MAYRKFTGEFTIAVRGPRGINRAKRKRQRDQNNARRMLATWQRFQMDMFMRGGGASKFAEYMRVVNIQINERSFLRMMQGGWGHDYGFKPGYVVPMQKPPIVAQITGAV